MRDWTVSYDDDGDIAMVAAPGFHAERLLAEAVEPVVAQPIDTYVWTVEEPVIPYSSAVEDDQTELYLDTLDRQLRLIGQEANREAPNAVVEAVQNKGVSGFLGYRVNDIHDRRFPEVRRRFKLDHPEYLIGGGYPTEEDENTSFEATRSALDFARPEVRRHKLDFIESMLSAYPHDGLMLDFLRHAFYFAPKDMEKGWDLLSDFVSKVHEMLRGKPLWVRVPTDFSVARWFGMDLRTWVRRSLVDTMVVGLGSRIFDVPSDEVIDFCHSNDTAVKLCLDGGGQRGNISRFRAAAMAAHSRGLDGVYTFNLNWNILFTPLRTNFSPDGPYEFGILGELANVDKLNTTSKTYAVEEKDKSSISTHVEPLALVPIQLTPTNAFKGYRLTILVGDDLKGDPRLRKAILGIDFVEVALGDDRVTLVFNSNEFQVGDDGVAVGGDGYTTLQVEFDVTGQVVSGENEIVFFVRHRTPNVTTNITVTRIELALEYYD